MQISKAEVAPTLGLLRHHGYTVDVTPTARGRRVVLRFGEERWEAEGASTTDALNSMLSRMLPSGITRSLFASSIAPATATATATTATAQRPAASSARSTSSSSGPQISVRRRVG